MNLPKYFPSPFFFLILVVRACTARRLDYQPLFGKGACAHSLKAQNKFLLGGGTQTGHERAAKSTTVDEEHVCHFHWSTLRSLLEILILLAYYQSFFDVCSENLVLHHGNIPLKFSSAVCLNNVPIIIKEKLDCRDLKAVGSCGVYSVHPVNLAQSTSIGLLII